MLTLTHRGLWNKPSEANSLAAFQASFCAGYGTETDLRHANGRIYLSHDPIIDPSGLPSLDEFLKLASDFASLPLFLNIKEDGLIPYLRPYLDRLLRLKVVLFDMSVPELVRFSKAFPRSMLCTRVSDVEPAPSASELCEWIWVDGFHRDLGDLEIDNIAASYPQRLVVVSSELHGRNPDDLWGRLWARRPNNVYGLCTDRAHAFEKGMVP